MTILDRLARVPGGLMLVPLLIGTSLNTVEQLHVTAIEATLGWLGVEPTTHAADGHLHRSFLNIGGFTSALAGPGATTLIALFLVCVASQMDFGVGRKAVKKGFTLMLTKWVVGVATAYGLTAFGDGFHGPFGLTTMTIIAGMTNANGGLYMALTSKYGDRSDVGAISVISLNDGPFLTMLGLGILGQRFPAHAFVSVLLPIAVGFLLGMWDPRVRRFLAPGERLAVPFFAFALGTKLSFGVFFDTSALLGGVVLGLLTLVFTGLACAQALRMVGEKYPIAAWCDASTAGNAVQTPAAVALAVGASTAAGAATKFAQAAPLAMAQISISVLTTALLCPLAVSYLARRWRSGTK
ncbi:MAG: 2-keto-3-deoxygluconate permease [Deltaproteobacteria bacterium]|nr:2-keto-3-deoxygluconate permease [Deltaproteobacteria bacterium]